VLVKYSENALKVSTHTSILLLMLCALEFIGRGMEAEFGVFWVEG
jgi:hypothetical protein